ncbi:hypothetical protein EYZ11_008170 [Aspergillus tanneri]|uniref:Uncharacterized protein n=1 Tax=Aspergillus tanneri TaxID=1220188 RepID=A0A4V3UNS5_9EURO|nr:hypothetical protein EYZ11_008170 [Aspergillus tanneri]
MVCQSLALEEPIPLPAAPAWCSTSLVSSTAGSKISLVQLALAQLHRWTPGKSLELLGLGRHLKLASYDEAYEATKQTTVQFSPYGLDMLMLEHRLCGSICYTPEEWRKTQRDGIWHNTLWSIVNK